MAAVSMLLPQSAKAQAEELKVMSYNIRLGSGQDGTNSWRFRAPVTLEMLKDQAPDVFGVQEALDYQVALIEEYADDYDCVGVGREDGRKKGEHMSIFWNKKTIKLLKWGTFWLSETPEVPSKGWDSNYFRTATWALMKDKKTGKKFYFVNTHLDHKGREAQKNGLKLIIDRIASINPQGYPMILTGDFNVKPDDSVLTDLDKIMQCTRKVALVTDNHNTFNGWGKAKSDSVIDYIYFSGFSRCVEYQTVTKEYGGRKFISDHFPIISTLVF
jgi:endonuclease/exonuclease/phosphatase family metal-dependent hydrolase